MTPGMVELGPRQTEENRPSPAAAAMAADLVIVGRTNRRALAGRGPARCGGSGRDRTVVDATPAGRGLGPEHLGRGDVVLYENDLPDHYP